MQGYVDGPIRLTKGIDLLNYGILVIEISIKILPTSLNSTQSQKLFVNNLARSHLKFKNLEVVKANDFP